MPILLSDFRRSLGSRMRQSPPNTQQAPPNTQQAPPNTQQAPPNTQQAPPNTQQAPPTQDAETALDDNSMIPAGVPLDDSLDSESDDSFCMFNDSSDSVIEVLRSDPLTQKVENLVADDSERSGSPAPVPEAGNDGSVPAVDASLPSEAAPSASSRSDPAPSYGSTGNRDTAPSDSVLPSNASASVGSSELGACGGSPLSPLELGASVESPLSPIELGASVESPLSPLELGASVESPLSPLELGACSGGSPSDEVFLAKHQLPPRKRGQTLAERFSEVEEFYRQEIEILNEKVVKLTKELNLWGTVDALRIENHALKEEIQTLKLSKEERTDLEDRLKVLEQVQEGVVRQLREFGSVVSKKAGIGGRRRPKGILKNSPSRQTPPSRTVSINQEVLSSSGASGECERVPLSPSAHTFTLTFNFTKRDSRNYEVNEQVLSRAVEREDFLWRIGMLVREPKFGLSWIAFQIQCQGPTQTQTFPWRALVDCSVKVLRKRGRPLTFRYLGVEFSEEGTRTRTLPSFAQWTDILDDADAWLHHDEGSGEQYVVLLAEVTMLPPLPPQRPGPAEDDSTTVTYVFSNIIELQELDQIYSPPLYTGTEGCWRIGVMKGKSNLSVFAVWGDNMMKNHPAIKADLEINVVRNRFSPNYEGTTLGDRQTCCMAYANAFCSFSVIVPMKKLLDPAQGLMFTNGPKPKLKVEVVIKRFEYLDNGTDEPLCSPVNVE
ncbi:unnamed protein product [Cyprideis torosa]|uniref:Uncharacterized protein n=1 Tax=Cyprideis torosa TaxID=163714 RepID=A0A7R8WLV7_9CRUS|nr:unnamed protein product [Cyprideis torosa]CAG0904691.1 unnamed protein product [Cyprideis torosa]